MTAGKGLSWLHTTMLPLVEQVRQRLEEARAEISARLPEIGWFADERSWGSSPHLGYHISLNAIFPDRAPNEVDSEELQRQKSIVVGDKAIDIRTITDWLDKGYYVTIETDGALFTLAGEEASIVREALQRLIRQQRDIHRPPPHTLSGGSRSNHVELIGILEWEPEITYTPHGRAHGHFLLRIDTSIEESVVPVWQTVMITDELAEYCLSNIQIDDYVKVEGSINAHMYVDDTGKPHIETFVQANHVQLI